MTSIDFAGEFLTRYYDNRVVDSLLSILYDVKDERVWKRPRVFYLRPACKNLFARLYQGRFTEYGILMKHQSRLQYNADKLAVDTVVTIILKTKQLRLVIDRSEPKNKMVLINYYLPMFEAVLTDMNEGKEAKLDLLNKIEWEVRDKLEGIYRLNKLDTEGDFEYKNIYEVLIDFIDPFQREKADYELAAKNAAESQQFRAEQAAKIGTSQENEVNYDDFIGGKKRAVPKKSNEKITWNNRSCVVYLGKRGGKYIKTKGDYVLVSTLKSK